MYDFHTHTTASDGQYSPTELIGFAYDCGINAISITDHDTIDGLLEGRQAAVKLGIDFIDGIEISARTESGIDVHMLGYSMDICNIHLKNACDEFKHHRDIRKLDIIEYLSGYGIDISVSEVEYVAGGDIIGRPHFAEVMYNKGYIPSIKSAFDLYLGTSEFSKIERAKPTPEQAIDIILQSGGFPVLAHPKILKLSDDKKEDFIAGLKLAGLWGIECYYGTNTDNETRYFLDISKKYGLRSTGGSDFHGERIKPDIRLGTGRNNSICLHDEQLLRELMGVKHYG